MAKSETAYAIESIKSYVALNGDTLPPSIADLALAVTYLLDRTADMGREIHNLREYTGMNEEAS